MDEGEISNLYGKSFRMSECCQSDLVRDYASEDYRIGHQYRNWNDMRRLDYDYVDYDRPQDFTAVSKIVGTSKNEPTYWFRRFIRVLMRVTIT